MKQPSIDQTATVLPGARISGDVTISARANIWYNAVIRGDMAPISIGERTNIQDGSIVHVDERFPTHIGSDVTVGHGCILHACTIEDACLIGMGARVLDGATVKRFGFVGAGALVPPGKTVGAGELWVGNPAKCVRRLDDTAIEGLLYSAAHYVRVKDDYLRAPRD